MTRLTTPVVAAFLSSLTLARSPLPGNPCDLLTVRQVAKATGVEITSATRRVSIGEIVYLQPEHNIRTATVRAQSNIIVMKIRGESLRKASSEVQACFDKAFIKMLVHRLVAANQQLAEWDSN